MSQWQLVKAKTDNERAATREIVKEALRESVEKEDADNRRLDSYLTEDAERMVSMCTTGGSATRPGQIDVPGKVGLSSAYARGERYARELEDWKRRGCPLP